MNTTGSGCVSRWCDEHVVEDTMTIMCGCGVHDLGGVAKVM